jgi:cystathionine beta-lyase/cystathionine gamma-synthase
MAAIAAVLQILKSGDHLITLNNGYGGKRNVTKYIVEYDVNKARSDNMVTMKKQGTES